MAKLRRPRQRQYVIIERSRLPALTLPRPMPTRTQHECGSNQQKQGSEHHQGMRPLRHNGRLLNLLIHHRRQDRPLAMSSASGCSSFVSSPTGDGRSGRVVPFADDEPSRAFRNAGDRVVTRIDRDTASLARGLRGIPLICGMQPISGRAADSHSRRTRCQSQISSSGQ